MLWSVFLCISIVENLRLLVGFPGSHLLTDLLLREKHFSRHEVEESFAVLLGWYAADCLRVLEDGAEHILDPFLLAEVRQDVNDAHEVDLGAISRDDTALLGLIECFIWSLLLMQ